MDVLMKKQERMCSAMAFIKSSETLFPARAPRDCQHPGLPSHGSMYGRIRPIRSIRTRRLQDIKGVMPFGLRTRMQMFPDKAVGTTPSQSDFRRTWASP